MTTEVVAEVKDNIDDVDHEIENAEFVPRTPSADAADEYVKRFEFVEAGNTRLKNIIASFAVQPDQDRRLFAVMHYIAELQKVNDNMYDLLVEMNNFFAPK